MTDNEIREVVNELRKIAKNFCYTQQLRERISSYIVPILKAARATPADHSQLMAFYSVETADVLIAEMERHIEKLQSRLPQNAASEALSADQIHQLEFEILMLGGMQWQGGHPTANSTPQYHNFYNMLSRAITSRQSVLKRDDPL